MTVKLPAKAVSAAITHLIDVYRRDRKPGEGLPAFIDRVGKNALKDELIPYTLVPAFPTIRPSTTTGKAEEEFVLEDLGPGECAGGALEMIENGILEADQELYQAKLLIDNHQYAVSVNKSYRAVFAAAKALLVTEGLEPSTRCRNVHGIRPPHCSERRGAGNVSGIEQAGRRSRAEGYNGRNSRATKCRLQKASSMPAGPRRSRWARISSSPAVKEQASTGAGGHGSPSRPPPCQLAAPVYDLRGVACPLNYVKTKLKLEMMDAGERLEVWLDAGEPIKNVPMSLKNDGHVVHLQEALEPDAAHYRILVEKVE